MTQRKLLWTPQAKERPRTVHQNGRVMTFTPKRTRDTEAMLAAQWVGRPAEGPISVGLLMTDEQILVNVVACNEPNSRKLRRGDIDNYSKLIMDALNGHAWLDDRQIVALTVRKV